MTKTRKIKHLFLTFFVLILAICQHPIGLAANQCRSSFQKFTIEQGIPELYTLAENEGVRRTDFVGTLTRPSGKHAGILTGTITDYYADFNNEEYEIRRRFLDFAFPDGEILATGNSFYPIGQIQIEPGTSIIIPVIGGSGCYIGATGEVKTTRNRDGTYTHKFKLLKDRCLSIGQK